MRRLRCPEARIQVFDSPQGTDRVELRRRGRKLVADGVRRLVVDVDGVKTFDYGLIATVIAILRALRERGGSLVLVAGKTRHLETIAVTALDKILEVRNERDLALAACAGAPIEHPLLPETVAA